MNRQNILPGRCTCRLVSAFFIVLLGVAPRARAQEFVTAGVGAAKIEFVTREANPPAQIIDHDTLSCLLPEGETTFVVSFSNASALERFTFRNENAAAHGELKIAVSNDNLPPNSPKWTPVDGAIAFSHKRLFNLSMVGIDARYLRLSFRVDKAQPVVGPDLQQPHSLPAVAAR